MDKLENGHEKMPSGPSGAESTLETKADRIALLELRIGKLFVGIDMRCDEVEMLRAEIDDIQAEPEQ